MVHSADVMAVVKSGSRKILFRAGMISLILGSKVVNAHIKEAVLNLSIKL